MIGGLIGAIIGFVKGGIFGMLFGGFVGSWVHTWVAENLLGKPSKQTQIQHAYFEALFTTMGKLAKVDGIVTASEIHKCELIIQKMRLNTEQRNLAIKFFNRGKLTNFDVRPCIDKFYRTTGRSYSIKQMFMEMLLDMASAENKINLAEWQLLLNVCEYLRFPQQLFVALVRMRGFNVHGQYNNTGSSQGSHRQWTPPRQQKTNSYQVLGVAETDSKKHIRRAYKKLMSSHHPDKLIAKGLPPEMIEVAKTKTQNIQAAWENIKNSRGF